MNYVIQMLHDSVNSKPSSTKLAGFVLIGAAIGMVFCHQDKDTVETFLYAGTGLLGLSKAESMYRGAKQDAASKES